MSKADLSPVWHPFTQHALFPDAVKIARGEGAGLFTEEGKRIIDAISSWWVVTHGHCHPTIIEAIREQAQKLDQVIFAGFTHEPAEQLARGLVERAPAGLSHVFYSDSGSTAVEVAVKMALGTWRNIGRHRSRILVLEHGYHGDTVGGMSLGERGIYNAAYEPLLFDVATVPFPEEGAEQRTLDALEALCADAARKPAAFIAEPLILGAGGMLTYSPEVLKEMARICAAHDVFFIADEVMTGWGRTGTLFACEQAGVTPDIMCVSKGITGGSMPLAATLCRREIFEAHFSQDRAKTFFHSSSYTANPIACAAALANLKVWKEEPVRARIASLAASHKAHLGRLARDPRFTNIRQMGTIAVVELKVPDSGYLAELGPKLYRFFMDKGLLIRPLGNTVYLMPPYCISEDDLAALYGAIEEAAELVAGQRE